MPEEKLDVGQVINRTFAAIRGNLLPFAAASLLFIGIPSFIQSWLLIRSGGAGPSAFFSSSYWVGVFIAFLLGCLLQVFVVRASILHLRGNEVRIGEGLVNALRLSPEVIAIAFITGIFVGLGLILLIVPGIIAYLTLIVATPALVVEGKGISDSIVRSRDLTRGSRWRIFLLVLIAAIVSTFISAIFGVAIGASAVISGLPTEELVAAAQALGQAIGAVISAAGVSALYIELRRRDEGDIEALEQIFS